MISACNIEVVETWGILEDIKFALSKGFNRIEIQPDNKRVVNKINGKKSFIGAPKVLLTQINQMFLSDILAKFLHI